MLVGILFNICATFDNAKNVECDIRVIYNYTTPSLAQCKLATEVSSKQMLANMQQANPEMTVVAIHSDCLVHNDLKVILNDLPDFMFTRGYSYTLSFK